MFQRFANWIKELFSKMFNSNQIKNALQIDVAVSPKMSAALTLWVQMYEGRAEWLKKDVDSLNLPAIISAEISQKATVEMKAKVEGSARADYLNEQMQIVIDNIQQYLEFGCAKGGIVFKPRIDGDKIAVDVIQADYFYPIAFDSSLNMTGVVFIDHKQIGKLFYTRLEIHKFQSNVIEVENFAFRSTQSDTLGNEVPLTEVPEWADIEPYARFTDVKAPLYGYFRYPMANHVEPTNPMGVSCFSRAQHGNNIKLIQRADEMFSNLVWEFKSGERAVYVDESAFDRDPKTKKPILPDNRLYRALSGTGDIGKANKLFDDYTPEFREAQIKSGLNDVKWEIEFACGLAYGTISDPNVEAKTATEVKSSQQRTYVTITNTQKALRTALNGLLYAMDVWAELGKLAPRGEYRLNIDYDDSVITDKDLQFSQDSQALGLGTMAKYEWRMRQYKEDEVTAKTAIALIDAEIKANAITEFDTE